MGLMQVCKYGTSIYRKVVKKSYPQIKGGTIRLKYIRLKPVSKIAVGKFESRVRGQTRSSHGKTVSLDMLHGGTIFYDYNPLTIRVKPQDSLNGT